MAGRKNRDLEENETKRIRRIRVFYLDLFDFNRMSPSYILSLYILYMYNIITLFLVILS